MTLKQLIQHFVNHRDEVITRRTIYDLKIAKHRMHILEALITAINNIDEVIKIIKESRDTEAAKLALEKRFDFDDEQAQAIVDMQLKRLTHLLIEDLQKEIKELQAWIDYLSDLLAHHFSLVLNTVSDTCGPRNINDKRISGLRSGSLISPAPFFLSQDCYGFLRSFEFPYSL